MFGCATNAYIWLQIALERSFAPVFYDVHNN